MKRALVLFGPVVALCALIVFLSSRTSIGIGFSFPGMDKVAHFVVYGLLGLLLARAMGGYGLSDVRALRFSGLLGSLFGLTDELHQSTVPGREADVWDFAVDVVGVYLGAMLWLMLQRRMSRAAGEPGEEPLE